jgi:hypothetical protein
MDYNTLAMELAEITEFRYEVILLFQDILIDISDKEIRFKFMKIFYKFYIGNF